MARNSEMFIPPVLRRARFVGLAVNGTVTRIIFASEDDLIAGDGYVHISMAASTKSMIYHYSKWDPGSQTVIHYSGPHGDPALDESELSGT